MSVGTRARLAVPASPIKPESNQLQKALLLFVFWTSAVHPAVTAVPKPKPPHPFKLQSQLAPHPAGCPPNTVFVESGLWWTTDGQSLPNATNYGKIKLAACWPHLNVFRDSLNLYPVLSIEDRTQPRGGLYVERMESAYQAGGWLDPCPFQYQSWPADGQHMTFDTCVASGGQVLGPNANPWIDGGRQKVLANVLTKSGWGPAPPVTATQSNTSTDPSVPSMGTTDAQGHYVQICPQDNTSSVTLPSPSSAAAGLTAQQSGSCAANCPYCYPPIVNNSGSIISSQNTLAAPVTDAVSKCIFTQPLNFNTQRFPSQQIAENFGMFAMARYYLQNPLEKMQGVDFSPNWGVRGFELVTSFGLIAHKGPGPVNLKHSQEFNYNNHDGNELSTRTTGWMQGNSAAYIRPAWRLPIMGNLHWYLKVFDCQTDHGGTPMEQWTIAIDADPDNGVSGLVLSQGTQFWVGMLHVDTRALGLTSGWHNLAVIIRARDPDTLALKTLVHRHWFQLLTSFPTAAGKTFMVYPDTAIGRIQNFTNEDPRPNVQFRNQLTVGANFISPDFPQWTERYRGVMTFDLQAMNGMRCGFKRVILYVFLQRIMQGNGNPNIWGTNTTMHVQVYATTQPNYVTPETTDKPWGGMLKQLTKLGVTILGKRMDVLQWQPIELDVQWLNNQLFTLQNRQLFLVLATPSLARQVFYFASVQDGTIPMPGPGYMPFLYFEPSC